MSYKSRFEMRFTCSADTWAKCEIFYQGEPVRVRMVSHPMDEMEFLSGSLNLNDSLLQALIEVIPDDDYEHDGAYHEACMIALACNRLCMRNP